MRPLYYPHSSLTKKVPGVHPRHGVPRNCRRLIKRPELAADPPPRVLELKPWVIEYLTSYQTEGWGYAHPRTGAYYYWAAGAGKTLGAICWALSGDYSDKIVIVTKANTKGQWKREFEKYTTLHPTVLEGQAAPTIDPSIRIVILSYEILKYWVNEIARWQGGKFLSLVFDEIHRLKSWKRKEKYVRDGGRVAYRMMDNQATAGVRLAARAYRRLGLSATPIRNTIADLWAQLDLLEPGCWGTNWDFVHRYCDARKGEHGGLNTTGKSNIKELQLRLKEVMHKVPYEEMAKALPPKRRQLCYLGASEQGRPGAFAQDMKRAAKAGKQALFEMKLLEAASRKRGWIVDVVTDAVASGQKVVVFTGRRNDCERLAEAIGKACRKLDAPFWWGHGGTSVKERAESVAAYAVCEEACAFVGTTDAFGEAVDGLQYTDLAIFGLLPWTPGQVTQAEGRFSRQGDLSRMRPVLVMYTIAEGTVDEHVADLVLEKLENVADVLEDGEARGVAGVLAGEADEEEIVAALLSRIADG